ncbi:hypothetical protein BH23PSE1_BH23PSE1_11530 [soil metagenome]
MTLTRRTTLALLGAGLAFSRAAIGRLARAALAWPVPSISRPPAAFGISAILT